MNTDEDRMADILRPIREKFRDEGWEIGFCVDDASQWYRAYHPKGIMIDRAQAASLIEHVNNIKIL